MDILRIAQIRNRSAIPQDEDTPRMPCPIARRGPCVTFGQGNGHARYPKNFGSLDTIWPMSAVAQPEAPALMSPIAPFAS